MEESEIDETLPEVVKDYLRSGAELEEIRLDDRGNWFHEGDRIDHRRIADLFSRSVGRTEGGTWILEVGRFTYPITVEDTGFFVESIDLECDPPAIRLSDGSEEPLDLETLEYEGDGRLYCRIKEGGFRARFEKAPYYRLARRVERREDGEFILPFGDREWTL